MRRFSFAVAVALCTAGAVAACGSHPADPGRTSRFEYSFEGDDMDGWSFLAADLELGDTTIAWSIARSTERATRGSASLRFDLANWNDAGKIWIERAFVVVPGRRYKVSVSYDFATADYSAINNWVIIAGASSRKPTGPHDLLYQGSTGTGTETDVGFKWLRKQYSFDVESGTSALVHVTIGVWGTWETPRTYYVDNVSVTIREVG